MIPDDVRRQEILYETRVVSGAIVRRQAELEEDRPEDALSLVKLNVRIQERALELARMV